MVPLLLFFLLPGPASADSALETLKGLTGRWGGEVPPVGATVEHADPRSPVDRMQELFLDGKDIVRAESILARSDAALGYRFFTKAGIFSATTDAATIKRLLQVHRCAGLGRLKRRAWGCRDIPSGVRIVYDSETKEIARVR